ncbi:MAG TPA: acyl-CoA synthetase [Gemmatimonadales bacterium]|nr:acyl-CoA synthetase [Gemmatimonadales bacterium]
MSATLPERAARHGGRVAIWSAGRSFSYDELQHAATQAATVLLDGRSDLAEERVAFLVPPSFEYVATQWGIWRAGGTAVPLPLSAPPAELRYMIEDADAALVVASPELAGLIRPIAETRGVRLVTTAELLAGDLGPLPLVEPRRRAMIVYTSGTTGRPKGVVSTHAAILAQVDALLEAWEWSPDDRALLVLPLHHVHGIVNVVCCALASGAACEMHRGFDAAATWARLASGDITVFMAVPTIYRRLIAAWEAEAPERRRELSAAAARLRLMVSGSAALPVQTLERWREITGHVLLERYGMTEIGMALSNPLRGERRAGSVGLPLPRVEVRLVDETGAPVAHGTPGELEVRGPNVFLEYWRRKDATAAAFRDGWFRTGDMAVLEDGRYRILGRTSVDIIKTGGEKVSALEIEEVLRTHPAVAECAVVGVADPEWGERVSAAVELRPGAGLTLEELASWARERLAPWKVPKALVVVGELPRNAMGKVTKPDVARLFGVPNVPRPSRF